ncbi:ribosomal RNA large subunit methyltransferase I [bacterium BMS3Bbin11]|nr:ribosomal RNA large subunit methyltransferase I [bacterium BMS3Abin11]GBE45408.1 ribosomal RNA large subunit methyltransferase I [bacterium BMS3Bbin11]GMT40733.1 MAG: SAM-dependent methyltransferase [bacterium]
MKTIILKSKAGRRFKQGHPWVFSNELEKPAERPEAGDIVSLRQQDGAFLAYGFYHPNSLIAFRALTGEEELPGEAFFSQLIDQAISLREKVYPQSNARRLIHSESDGLPGLIVDQFDDVLSVQINSAGMERLIEMLLPILKQKMSAKNIVMRNDSSLRNLEGLRQYTAVWQSDEKEVAADITENTIHYHVDVINGQKTGFFIDQRENRFAFRRFIEEGDRVLDAFCNDGGFALNALVAGAAHVDAVDVSESALARAEKNASLNNLSERIQFSKVDVMKWLPGLKPETLYDVVNLDPPTFASNRKSIPVARKAYRKLHGSAMQVLKAGGILSTACCSHHISEEDFLDSIQQAAIRTGRQCQMLFRGGPPADHPVLLSMPESGYLKFHIFRVL